MAKIKIMDKAVVVTSGVKLDDIKMIEKYRKAALVLMEGEGDKKEPVFALGTTGSSINTYGASFDHANAEGYAVLTMTTNYEGEKIKEFVADELGEAIRKLNKLEATIPGVLAAVKDERKAIMESITVE